jgi:hypothetical protein
MLSPYLDRLGLSEKEKTIILALAGLGIQPASVIARRASLDRVSTYRHLKKLSDQGLVRVYVRDGVQTFGLSFGEGIESYVKQQIGIYQELLEDVPLIDQELHALAKGQTLIPKIQMFEGKAGIQSLFRDVLFEAKQQEVRTIRMLSSNTFEQQLGDVPLSRFVGEFFATAKQRKIGVEVLEASGTLLPEYVRFLSPTQVPLEKLPASRGATSVILAGSALYLACYEDSQIGLKIKHRSMSQIFHFFFDAVGRAGR